MQAGLLMSAGPATVIRSIAAGRRTAANIDGYLGYHHQLDFGVTVPEPHLLTGRAAAAILRNGSRRTQAGFCHD